MQIRTAYLATSLMLFTLVAAAPLPTEAPTDLDVPYSPPTDLDSYTPPTTEKPDLDMPPTPEHDDDAPEHDHDAPEHDDDAPTYPPAPVKRYETPSQPTVDVSPKNNGNDADLVEVVDSFNKGTYKTPAK